MKKLIKSLEIAIKDPQKGLPDEIFYFIGRNTPYVNVDLLIKVPGRGILLTWRADDYVGLGWHIPGGIIRFRESWESRVKEVGRTELGIEIKSCSGPVAINQIITKKKERSHFISLLFDCKTDAEGYEIIERSIKKSPSTINFFKDPPKNLLVLQRIYEDYFL